MIRVAVVGYGYWGPNLVRALHATEGVAVAAICDTDPDRRETARRDHPWLTVRDDALAMPGECGRDGVAIATPVASHPALAAAAIDAGAHVLAVLEAADASMARRGAPVPLPEGAAR